MSMNLVTLLYLAASICFIQALKGLSHPTTSIRGNLFGMIGMAIAMLTTAALIVELSGGKGRGMLWVLYYLGWAIVFYSSFVIDHFELFGLKQVWMYLTGREPATAPFSERSIYRWVRHPLMLGFILAFWSAPTMSQGRLLFAVVTTVWILIAIQIEERDLEAMLGEPYRDYRGRTGMIVPSWKFMRGGKD